MDLSVIIVNTNERHVLEPCLRSIARETRNITCEIIVVDNASTDGTAEMLAGDFPHVQVIRNDRNLGFAGSNNRGIAIAKGSCILLLNPDTEVKDGALQKAVAFMNSRKEAGVIGCKLFYPSGTVQQSVRSFPSVWNIFCEASFLYLVFPRSHLIGKYHMTYFAYDAVAEVDWVSGACFMIRREVVDQLGSLDERFFIYSEEMEYCYRTWRIGYKVLFYPDAHVIHYWGGPRTTNQRLIYWGHRSQILFIRKHFRGIERWAMEFLKYLEVGVRIPVYAVAGVLTFNPRHFLKTRAYSLTLWKLLANRVDW